MSKVKPALGKGLGALIPGAQNDVGDEIRRELAQLSGVEANEVTTIALSRASPFRGACSEGLAICSRNRRSQLHGGVDPWNAKAQPSCAARLRVRVCLC